MRQTVREGGQSLAQIGKSLKLKGEIMGNEDLYIDGEDKCGSDRSLKLKGRSWATGSLHRRRGQSLAQIGKSLKLKGEIMGNEDLYIDGEVEGTVELKGNSLTVGPNGNVHADVSAHSITILGRLQGNVKVGERTEIRKTGSFEGELLTAQIVSEDGAVFRGSIDIVKLGQNVANTPAADGPARTVRKQKGPGTPRIVATTPNLGASTAPKP